MSKSTQTPDASYLSGMRALLLKDLRFYRVPAIALIIVGVLPYLMGLVTAFVTERVYSRELEIYRDLVDAALFAISLVALVGSAVGGMAIAWERSERTGDFIALLPVTRGQLILSKWLTATSILVCAAGIHAMIALLICLRIGWFANPPLRQPDWLYAMGLWIGCTLCLYGVAWLLGTFLKSGPISACVAIAVQFCMLVLVEVLMDSHRFSRQEMTAANIAISSGIGLSAMLLGTLYYLRRVSP